MRAMALLARLTWEAVLLIGVVVAMSLTIVEPAGRDLLAHQAVAPVTQLCVTGLLALGLSLSLRVGAPNLAVGGLAAVGGAAFARLCTSAGMPLPLALPLILLAAGVVGLVISVLVAALGLPSWAVSLALAVLMSAVAAGLTPADVIRVHGPDPAGWALPLAVLLALGSIGVGAAMWTNSGATVAGLAWPVADPGPADPGSADPGSADPGPAGSRGGPGAVVLAVATMASSMLAAAAGMVAVLDYRATTAPSVFGAEFLAWGLIPVLIAGSSLRSPRGPVTGVVLACALMVYGRLMFTVHGAPGWVPPVVMASLVVVGLVVGRELDVVVERMAGSRPGTDRWGIARDAAGPR
jgi:ribose/xylose/arabinose/galactoside ABC-type transport system permease subunit